MCIVDLALIMFAANREIFSVIILLDGRLQDMASKTFRPVDSVKEFSMKGRGILSLDFAVPSTNPPATETIEYLCDHTENSDLAPGVPALDSKQLLFFVPRAHSLNLTSKFTAIRTA